MKNRPRHTPDLRIVRFLPGNTRQLQAHRISHLDAAAGGESTRNFQHQAYRHRRGDDALKARGQIGGEAHHFAVTGEGNRPRRWRVRAPTYQNLQGVPAMIKDQRLADMTISLGSIDPCFSCTDRMEIVDLRTGNVKVWGQEEILRKRTKIRRRRS